MSERLIIRQLNQLEYTQVWQAMKQFTDTRNNETPDELWLVEHLPVFTQGQAGKEEHLLINSEIPVIKADRGGQITYHAPGQQIIYCLINLRRNKMGIRQLVTLIEQGIINALNTYNIEAYAKADAPGVYVNEKKIASLGLRVRKGCSFHGLALNVNMDLAPFLNINPCGYANLEMVQTADIGGPTTVLEAGQILVKQLSELLGATTLEFKTGLTTEA